jgi:hypothetical protein
VKENYQTDLSQKQVYAYWAHINQDWSLLRTRMTRIRKGTGVATSWRLREREGEMGEVQKSLLMNSTCVHIS